MSSKHQTRLSSPTEERIIDSLQPPLLLSPADTPLGDAVPSGFPEAIVSEPAVVASYEQDPDDWTYYESLAYWNPFLAYQPAFQQEKTVVHLQLPWYRPEGQLTPFEIRAVISKKDTVEAFLYRFLMESVPAHVWKAFQERYSDKFGGRMGRGSCFRTKDYREGDPIYYFYLASIHSPNARWSSQDFMMDLLTAQDKTLVIYVVRDLSKSALSGSSLLIIDKRESARTRKKTRKGTKEKNSSHPSGSRSPQAHSPNLTATARALTSGTVGSESNTKSKASAKSLDPMPDTEEENLASKRDSPRKKRKRKRKRSSSTVIQEKEKDRPTANDRNSDGNDTPAPNGKGTFSSKKKKSELDKEATWKTRFQELVEFKNKFGHCRVPTRTYHIKQLGRWVETQRKLGKGYPNSSMTAEHRRALDGLGFTWRVENRKPKGLLNNVSKGHKSSEGDR